MSQQSGLDRSRLQESRIATIFGCILHAGSGNQWRRKNDCSNGKVVIECKRTDAEKSITIKLDDLDDVRKNALLSGKTPLFHVEVRDRRYFVIDEDDFVEMAEKLGLIDA